VQVLSSGLARIDEEEKYMTGDFSMQIEFNKEELGFRIKERVLEQKPDAEDVCDNSEDKVVVSAAEAGVKSVSETSISAASDGKIGKEKAQDTNVTESTMESGFVMSEEKIKTCFTPPDDDLVMESSKIAEEPHDKLNVEEVDVKSNDVVEVTEVAEEPDEKSIVGPVETRNDNAPKKMECSDELEKTCIGPSLETYKIEDVQTSKSEDSVTVNIDDRKHERPCELVVEAIHDKNLIFHGLVENAIVLKMNDTTLKGMSFSQQFDILRTSKRPLTLTFIGKNYLKSSSINTSAYSSILKALVAEEKNDVQAVFNELVKGTSFGKELESSGEDCTATIKALLSNRGRLITLLQNFRAYEY